MLNLTKRPSLKYLLFGSLYFSEGLAFTLASVIVIIYFTEIGISIATATLVAGIAGIPWILKFVNGPIIDYFIKYGRKPFIIFGGMIGGLCLFPLAFIDPATNIIPFTLLLFISHTGIVFIDVSADAWAIQTSKAHELGKVNAAMTTGLFAGMAIASSVLVIIGTIFGFSITFISAGLLVLTTIILPIIIEEIKIVKKRQKILSLFKFEFKKKNTLIVALFALFSATNFGILLFIVPEYMMNILNLDAAQTGIITSLFPIATVIGAIIFGIISDKWGRKKILYILFTGIIVFTALLITANTWQLLSIIYPIIGFLHGGASYSVVCALFMDFTNPKIGATQYSIFTSLANFGDIGIGMISGTLVLMLGYSRVFLYATWLVGPTLLILYFIKTKN
jgi:MFS family permease